MNLATFMMAVAMWCGTYNGIYDFKETKEACQKRLLSCYSFNPEPMILACIKKEIK